MTEEFDVAEEDTMLLVFYDNASGQFAVTKLTAEGKRKMDDGQGIATSEVWGEWSEYLEPGDFFRKVEELVWDE